MNNPHSHNHFSQKPLNTDLIANKPNWKHHFSNQLSSTVSSVWEERRVGWPLQCVSNISPKIPVGRSVLGVPGWTPVLLYLTRSQHREAGGRKRRGRKSAVWWGADCGDLLLPDLKEKAPSVHGLRVRSLPLSLAFFSLVVGRRDVGNEA